MSGTRESLETAQEAAREARTRLAETMSEIKARLHPRALAKEGVDELRERGTAMAGKAAAAAQERPALAATIVAAILLLLLRHPIGRLIGRLFSKRDETVEPQAG
ncbi:MAG: hypothetical protein JWM38_2585 [Sphingomonas bacterium]|nr:hypothetical protein [Sphingomonas bacterium]MDB5685252.1 hypothetical protein [Sphingomonas bacterium]MDB5719158.1 hypothetical protein [Sphingomonas bacterium]